MYFSQYMCCHWHLASFFRRQNQVVLDTVVSPMHLKNSLLVRPRLFKALFVTENVEKPPLSDPYWPFYIPLSELHQFCVVIFSQFGGILF